MEFESILAGIDWARMAAPQADQYDTDITLKLATSGGSPLRPLPHRRRPLDDAVTFCENTVAIRPAPQCGLGTANVVPAAPDHPNLPRAASLLSRWPAAYSQFKRLIDTVYPYSDTIQARSGSMAFGSSSHSHEKDFGSLLITVDDPFGAAQALVHEMAHQKLRALGVSFERADRLIVNPPSQLFESPIRKYRTRPMTAVFHAQYSFIHVTALDLFMLHQAQESLERSRILMLLARNVPRIRAGYDEIASHIITDENGGIFVNAFMSWSKDVLEHGQAVLDANGYGAS